MKVIILTGEPFPNGMAAVNRIKCYARALKEGSVDVEVLIWRRTERQGIKPKNTERVGEFNGIPFYYIGSTPLRDSNMLVRRINDFRDFFHTKQYLRNNLSKGDVLFLYLNNVEKELVFLNIAHSKGAFCVRDLCELPYGTGTETSKAVKLRKETLEILFPQLDGIISISDELMKIAKKHSSPDCKHIKVPILVDYDYYYMEDKSANVDVPFIFHSGTLFEQKDGILGIIEAFGKAVKKMKVPVKFISTGRLENSPHHEEIKQLICKYHLEDKVQMKGYLATDTLKDYISKASLVIINKYRTQQNNFCFSTKLGEYMAAAKPVLITNVGEAMNWLKDGKNAYIVETENNDLLANAIVYIFTHIDESRKIGIEGQTTCRNSFDYKNWIKPLVDYIVTLK